jgi:16S rRNA (guanine527-N7)-methyltransferase
VDRDRLAAVLEQARGLGFLGPGETGPQHDHSLAFARAWDTFSADPPSTYCDLGAGGGVPGLVLAAAWTVSSVVLLDAGARRCQFLRAAVETLGLEGRVGVAEGRAELLARDAGLDGAFQLVTARSFGRPGVVAECGARLLAPHGVLLVAEPPDEADPAVRWPAEGLVALGLGPPRPIEVGRRFVAMRRVAPCPDAYPRRVGIPAKRPLF